MSIRSPNAVDVRIGARVRQARILAGIGQEKLGDKLDLTFQQVQKYEKGSNRISAARLVQIAAILNKPVTWFLEGIDSATGAVAAVADPLSVLGGSTDGVRLADAFNAISDPAARRAVVHVAEMLATNPSRLNNQAA